MDPATIDELRQKLRHDYQTGAAPPPISEAELKQQLREGIAPGEETPQSVLDRFREDPSSVEKGDLHSALSKIAVSQGTKADLADQLQASIDALGKASRSGAITPEDAKASEATLRRAWRDEMNARGAHEPGPVQGLDGLGNGVPEQPLPPSQPDLFNQSVQKSLAEANPEAKGPIASAPSEDERAAHFAQHTASNFKHVQVPGNVQKAYRNAIALANAPTRFLTYGHLPVLRQGFGFALTHPSTAREAIQNLATVARNPEAWGALNEGLNKGVFVKAAMDAGWLHEAERPAEAAVTQVINKIPGMLRSGESARAYLTTLRKAGYESEAARLYHAGVTGQASYESLWNTISDVTGHGLRRGQSISAGGMSPVLSPQALAGRFRSLVDPFIQKGSINPLDPGARSVAIRNLIALGGVSAAINGISKAAGADVNWNLNTPVGKVKLGESTLDPSTGLASIIKLGIKLAEVTPGVVHGNLTPLRDALGSYFRGQLGPVPDAAYDTWTGQDWQGKPFNLVDRTTTGNLTDNEAFRSLVPIAAQSVFDAVKANGPIGALYAAPSFGAMSVETNLVTAARDKAAKALGAKDYASAGPEIRNQVQNDPAVLRAQGAPTPYQAAAAKAHEPILAEVKRNEDLFDQGKNTQKLSEVYHDEGVANRQAAHDLEGQFASQFASFSKTKYSKAIEGYYGQTKLIPDGEDNAGGVDFDATAAAQQDYLEKLPADEKAWVTEALNVTEGKKSQPHQDYDSYIKAKKAAGYFADGADSKALDRANPSLDVMSWYLNGTAPSPSGKDTTPTLNSVQAVNGALALKLPNRPVKMSGLARPINESPETEAAFKEYGARVQNYLEGYKNDQRWTPIWAKEREGHAQSEYGKPYAQLAPWQQKETEGWLSSETRKVSRENAPDLDAYLAWAGDGSRTIAGNQAALDALQALRKKYGKELPSKDGKPITYR